MNDLSNLSRDELFGVLLCGEKPKEGISLNEYMEEWNVRVKKEVDMKLLYHQLKHDKNTFFGGENMRKYTLYYNQKSMLIQAESFDMAYAGNKSWFTPGYVFFIEDMETKELRKYVVK